MRSYYTWLISLSIMLSRFIHVVTNAGFSFFFFLFCNGWIIFIVCIHIPELLWPFIHQWTLRLFPGLGCCKYISYELGGCRYLFTVVFLFSLVLFPWVGLLGHFVVLVLVFWKPPNCLHSGHINLHSQYQHTWVPLSPFSH